MELNSQPSEAHDELSRYIRSLSQMNFDKQLSYIKFVEILPIGSQDIEWKQNLA